MLPSQEIIGRVFLALEDLKENNKISGVREFCNKYGFNRKKFSSLKNPNLSQYTGLEMEVYFALAYEFKVSLDWLFFNSGPMYKSKRYIYQENKKAG